MKKFKAGRLKPGESRILQRIRTKLWKKCPGCMNCFKRTRLPTGPVLQHDHATIQHFDASYSIWRLFYGNIDESRMELWCFECNKKDGRDAWNKIVHSYDMRPFKIQDLLKGSIKLKNI